MTSNPFYQVANVQYISPVNVELVGKALAAKQQKFDLGVEQIQTMYSQLSNIDLSREADKEYLTNRLNLIKQEVGKLGNVDLSKRQNTATLTNYMSTAIDDIVMAGAQGTKVRRRIEEQAEEARKKGGDDYNPSNVAYSLKDVAAWESRGQLGEYYRGNKEYVPYFDRTKLHKEVYDKLTPDIKFIERKGEVDTYLYQNKVVTGTRIKEILDKELMLNSKYAQQLQVDAWSAYRGADNNAIKINLLEQKKKEAKDIDTEVETLRRTFNIEKNPDRKARLGEKLKQGEDYQSRYKANIDSFSNDFDKNPEAYKVELFKNQVLDGLRAQYEVNNFTETKQFTDSAALARLNSSLRIKEQVSKDKDDVLGEIRKLITENKFDEAKRFAGVADLQYKTKGDYTNFVEYLRLGNAQGMVEEIDIDGMAENILTSSQEFNNNVKEVNDLYNTLSQKLGSNLPISKEITQTDLQTYANYSKLSPTERQNLNNQIQNYNKKIRFKKTQEDIIKDLSIRQGVIENKETGESFWYDTLNNQWKKQDKATIGEKASKELSIYNPLRVTSLLDITTPDIYPFKNFETDIPSQQVKQNYIQNRDTILKEYQNLVNSIEEKAISSNDYMSIRNEAVKNLKTLTNAITNTEAIVKSINKLNKIKNYVNNYPAQEDIGEFKPIKGVGFKDITAAEATTALNSMLAKGVVPDNIKETYNKIIESQSASGLLPLSTTIKISGTENAGLYETSLNNLFDKDIKAKNVTDTNMKIDYMNRTVSMQYKEVIDEKKGKVNQMTDAISFDKIPDNNAIKTFINQKEASFKLKEKQVDFNDELKASRNLLTIFEKEDSGISVLVEGYEGVPTDYKVIVNVSGKEYKEEIVAENMFDLEQKINMSILKINQEQKLNLPSDLKNHRTDVYKYILTK